MAAATEAIDYDLRAADGTQFDHLIHKTIHRFPSESLPMEGADAMR
jgi:hypothetical protein